MSGSPIKTLAGSTKVLAIEELGKTPAANTVVASAVAFMGPKRRRPPVFYFSSMMAADADALATNSSLSVHPASVSAYMARPQVWEARSQTRERRHPCRHGATRHSSSSWPGAASC
jgi:hypothetical protein